MKLVIIIMPVCFSCTVLMSRFLLVKMFVQTGEKNCIVCHLLDFVKVVISHFSVICFISAGRRETGYNDWIILNTSHRNMLFFSNMHLVLKHTDICIIHMIHNDYGCSFSTN